MEQILSLILGVVASQLQGKYAKVFGRKTKFIISLVACFWAALMVQFGEIYMSGAGVDWENIFSNFSLVFAASQGYYQLYFKNKS